jgi:hypothetical protein
VKIQSTNLPLDSEHPTNIRRIDSLRRRIQLAVGVLRKTVRPAQCFLRCFPRRPHPRPSRRLESIPRRLGRFSRDGFLLRGEAFMAAVTESATGMPGWESGRLAVVEFRLGRGLVFAARVFRVRSVLEGRRGRTCFA